MATADTDLLLIANAKEDIKLFRFLYEKYHNQIYLYIHKRTKDKSTTKDIVADTFMKAIENLPKYEYRGLPFSAWLYRTAINELNSYFRKSNKIGFVSFEKKTFQYFENEVESDEIHIEKEEILVSCLAKLPADDQELVSMIYADELPYLEIAKIKNTTEENIKVKIFRIRQKLKKLLGS